MNNKKIFAAVVYGDAPVYTDMDAAADLAVYLEQNQADGLLLMDLRPATDTQESELIAMIKKICAVCDLPVSVMQHYRRFEDTKKIIYAGAAQVVVPYTKEKEDVIKEAAARFDGQVAVCIDVMHVPDADGLKCLADMGICEVYMDRTGYEACAEVLSDAGMKVMITDQFEPAGCAADENAYADVLKAVFESEQVAGAADLDIFGHQTCDISALKATLKDAGISMHTFESSIPFSQFKLNSDGLIPVIVQDYKSGKVLMLAYMNEASYAETLRSGRMTYFSRSRQELWKKGETSGHYQYVKSIDIDCDNDTMLAKVAQVGAACHTGNESCFYTNLVKKEYDDVNPLTIFDEIMGTILDRKANPKEGSYTNYLFEKGLDKILKKVGEEATEIVIAAKNPDAEELKYEISDFLYHVMVLMAERGVTWKEITKELAARH